MTAKAIPEVVSPDDWIRERPWIDLEGADIDGYVSSLTRKPDYDLRQKLRDWQRNGYVVFEKVVSGEEIDRYLADIDLLKRDFGQYDVEVEVRGKQLKSRDLEAFPEDLTGVKLNHMHCFSRHAARLSLTPRVVDFLTHVFRAPASVCQSLTFWRGSEQPIHIDYPYVRQQRPLAFLAASWIPLEDVHPDSGPLGYYPGAHNIERSGFFDWGNGSILDGEGATRTPTEFATYLRTRMAELGIQKQEFCPKKGDVLLWHGNLPHEGTRVNDPSLTRKSYVTHFTSEPALPDWMRNHDAFGRPIGFFENGAYCYRSKWYDEMPALPSWNARTKSQTSWLNDKVERLKRKLGLRP